MIAGDPRFEDALLRGAASLGIPLDEPARARLSHFAVRLLEWNRRVNLTAITDPAEVAEKHLVDSLTLLRSLGSGRTLLDLGSGAGIPGAVLACVRADLDVTCVDSIAKKIAFVKAISAELDLPVRARALRAGGRPEAEGVARADAVVSRALADPARWVPLGAPYVAPGGVLLGMLGREADAALLEVVGARSGLRLEALDRFVLPLSGAARAVARWRSAAPAQP
jgi:16S rRNA (guanine527-N7)-methyltransferase